MTNNDAHMRLQAIEEYIDAVADFHEAKLLMAEMRQRVISAIESNRVLGISKSDPLGAIVGINLDRDVAIISNSTIDAVTNAVVAPVVKRSMNGNGRTRKSPRNSPGMTKKTVYEALPGDVRAIVRRTGFSSGQVHAATADLVAGGLAERHGTRGNYTYVVSGDVVNWEAKQFAAVCDGKEITS